MDAPFWVKSWIRSSTSIMTGYHFDQWRIQKFGSEGSSLRNSGQSRQYFVTSQ